MIKGFAELLTEAELPTPEASLWAKTIKRNAEELNTIINDILDLSKVEAGKMELEAIDFNLESLIDEVRTLADYKAREKGISLEFRVSPLVPSVISSDPTRLRQLLLNIVGNAVKFTSRGSVKVDVLMERDQKLKFKVTDTGIGIETFQVEKLFQPFSQADGSVTRLFGGTGLGLAFSKKLSQALGGDLVLLSSSPGQGSVFEFSILPGEASLNQEPSSAGGHAAVPNIITQIRPNLISPLAGVKILLVEDSPDNQALIGRYLRAAGATVETADDGNLGIEKAVASSYDIVLMDIQMPKLDGLSAMSELRRRGYAKPIVALTAHAMREEKERALSAGFDGYLTKPIDRKTLIETLASLSF
ncbi:MAG: response regulator [Proteobacteria bacterium]|nr:MAG: response regulator [Pseudomonadota bacterium]